MRASVRLIDDYVVGFDGDHAAIGHRIPGINHEVQEHLLDLARIDVDYQTWTAMT